MVFLDYNFFSYHTDACLSDRFSKKLGFDSLFI